MDITQEIIAIKGDICFSKSINELITIENGYIIVQNGKVIEVSKELADKYKNVNVLDHLGCLIIPGFVDIHLHAPQFENTGLGYDKQLLPWLETYTFPEEAKFQNTEYAQAVYERFTDKLIEYGTTRSVIFSSIHKQSTKVLIDILNKKGLGAYVGKVNMDQNSPDYLIESCEQSLNDTEEILKEFPQTGLVAPIITPRFVPTCSKELLAGLSELSKKYNAPVQSHLNENKGEIEWVKELHEDSLDYADVYDKFGLFGHQKTVMAHCVYNNEREIELMKQKGVFVAHCPNSNSNLASGIAPIKKYIKSGINIGLGSDIAGGNTVNMRNVIVNAMQVSRLYSTIIDPQEEQLSFNEAFYLATKGGGSFFEHHNVGSFENGYEFDALIVEDNKNINKRTLEERLQKFIFAGSKKDIKKVYVNGKLIAEK